ncbi:MAG: T9SS type A sorting domain-containing protein [Bacteroidales bacterium]
MKKFTLVMILITSVLFTSGQLIHKKVLPPDANYFEKMPVRIPDPMGGSGDLIIGEKPLSSTIIGNTYYDLQTYGSIQQRLYAYPDGTIGATWMMALETPDWPDRGTGYNYYDGSSWGPYPTTRIESGRTGWPSYAPLGTNGEINVAHYLNGADWVLLFCKRANKGQGSWTEFMLGGPVANVGIVWPAMMTNGIDHQTIHILARTYGDPYMGQDGALVYSRSSDGGLTWEIENHFFTELGSSYFLEIGADEYTWANPVGDTIAFAVGFSSGHAYIMKSTDNGDTWQKTVVFQSPFYPPPGGATPTFGAGDGSSAIALDNEGVAHVAFGRMRHVYDETGAAFYYPFTDGLIYWNETMDALDTTIISSYTLDYLLQNGNLIGWVPGDPANLIGFPSYYTSLTSNPQITIDGERIFVIWSGLSQYNNGVWNYRKINGNSSNDGGLTWNGMVDLTDELVFIFSECVFPSLAPTIVNNQFHLIFQEDNEPGIFIWAAQQPAPGDNRITYQNNETYILTGIEDNQSETTKEITLSQNFPNPFRVVTWFDLYIGKDSQVELLVFDITGKLLQHIDFGRKMAGNIRLQYHNMHLSSGVYFYSIKTDSGTRNGKFMIQ